MVGGPHPLFYEDVEIPELSLGQSGKPLREYGRPAPILDPKRAIAETARRRQPLSAEQQQSLRRSALVLGLVLLFHLIFLGLALFLGGRKPLPVPPPAIPVQLVQAPPEKKPVAPPPPPTPPQPPAPKPPPVREPLASDDFGSPDSPDKTASQSPRPAQGKVQPEAGAPPPPPRVDTPKPLSPPDVAAINPNQQPAPPQTPPPPTPEQSPAGGAPPPPSTTPPQDPVLAKTIPIPEEKPSIPAPKAGGPVKPTHRPEAPVQMTQRIGKIPGPNASKDEYIAYILSLINNNIANAINDPEILPRGTYLVEIEILANGHIASVRFLYPSDSAGFNRMAVNKIYGLDPFPKVPPYLLDEDGSTRMLWGPPTLSPGER